MNLFSQLLFRGFLPLIGLALIKNRSQIEDDIEEISFDTAEDITEEEEEIDDERSVDGREREHEQGEEFEEVEEEQLVFEDSRPSSSGRRYS